HGGAEPDQAVESERLGVGGETGRHVGVARKVAVGGGHREPRILHAWTGHVRAQGRVRARESTVVLIAPLPAHIGPAFEALDGDPVITQGLEYREPGRTGSYHGHLGRARPRGHRPSPSSIMSTTRSGRSPSDRFSRPVSLLTRNVPTSRSTASSTSVRSISSPRSIASRSSLLRIALRGPMILSA